MANALKNTDCFDASVSLDVKNALEAAIVRAMEVGTPERTVMDYVSREEWKTMDASCEQISVSDPD